MGIDSAIFKTVLVLHIATAVIGFGGIIAHGTYNAKAFASKAGEAAVLFKHTRAVTAMTHYALYALFALGIILIVASDGTFGMGDPWVGPSFLVWFAVLGVAHGLVKPSMTKLQLRAEELSASASLKDDETSVALAKKLAIGEAATQLLLVISLVLMVWKPGA